jgi:hypothetical protein
MAEPKKVLWVVNYNKLSWFIERATFVKATAVAIRTDNDLERAIPAFHDKGLQVYGWRWPSARRDAAMREADKVVGLLAKGLDGYYVDPEGHRDKKNRSLPDDWNQNGLERLAEDFCKAITKADPSKPFGITSHYRGKRTFGKLPWASFFKYSTVFLPQAYWRFEEGEIGHGIPEDNYRNSINFWAETGAPREKIVPMAGALEYVTAAEIRAHVNEAKNQGIASLHFYDATEKVKPGVWNAIAAAEN